MLITFVLLAILTIGAVSANEGDFNETLAAENVDEVSIDASVDDEVILDDNSGVNIVGAGDDVPSTSAINDLSPDCLASISKDKQDSSLENEDVLGRVVTSDENGQNGSAESIEPVLGSEFDWTDIKINANPKSIDADNGNAIVATIKLPKGHTCYSLHIDGYLGDNVLKLSKLSKTTAKGIITYTVRLKDLKNYDAESLANNKQVDMQVKYYNVHEKIYDFAGNKFLLKFNKKANTFKLKKKKDAQVWIGPYDRKSGTNKALIVHLAISTLKKPMADSKSKHIPGKKVKITINGVVYIKKTNSKGLIKIYPPRYLPAREFVKVKMEFAGDNKYTDAMTINNIQIYKNPALSKSKIKAGSKTFSVNQTKKYTVKLVSNGKAIKKAKLKFTINGKKYSAKTNSKGTATFNLSKLTKTGKFKGTVLYMGDKKHYMSYKNVKLTVN